MLKVSLENNDKEKLAVVVENILNEMAIPKIAFYHNIRQDLGTIEDFKQEFRIHAFQAALKAKLDIGNPLIFIFRTALNRVKDFAKKKNRFSQLPETFDLPYNEEEKLEVMISVEEILDKLTGRQKEVATLILSPLGQSENYMKAIGEKLGITPQCVNQYLKKIKEKIKCQ